MKVSKHDVYGEPQEYFDYKYTYAISGIADDLHSKYVATELIPMDHNDTTRFFFNVMQWETVVYDSPGLLITCARGMEGFSDRAYRVYSDIDIQDNFDFIYGIVKSLHILDDF